MDSLIRLNQIYQPELSGYIASIINSLLTFNTSGDIIPSGSGIKNLGSQTNYYKNLYVNGISVPSGSGITIGNTFFTAYSSGGAGIVQVGDYQITSSGNFISIQGPQGIQGPSGATGVIGPTGIGITGTSYNQSNYQLTFKYSNGTNSLITLPPLSGATGISLTGFYRTGDLIYPQFSNKTTGSSIQLVSGAQGIKGEPGNVIFNFYSGVDEGRLNKVNFPNSVKIEDYYNDNSFPDISLMRGMSYSFSHSGLSTHKVTEEDYKLLTGALNNPNIPDSIIGTLNNFYLDPANGTGYWRIAFFDPVVEKGIYSGHYTYDQFVARFPLKNEEIYGDSSSVDIYRNYLTFNIKFSAKDEYRYGFVIHTIGEFNDEILTEDLSTDSKSIAIILGNAYISSGVGPRGPQGEQGPEGPPGTGVGPKGDPGAGIAQIDQRQVSSNLNESEIRFVYENGEVSEWITLPEGGPAGPSGAAGSFINHFSGEYSSDVLYKLNDTISRFGSTYIYINSSPQSNKDPENNLDYWQLLAKSGDKGEIGPSGIGDKYSSNFFVKSGLPTGANIFVNGITGITVNGTNLSGIEAKFKVGDVVSFKNSGIVGYSYTPYQNIVLSSNSVNNSYFYGSIRSYDSKSGIISLITLSGGTGVINTTILGEHFLWYNYGNTSINLGANLMSGARGPRGEIGPQGNPGTPSLLRNDEIVYINYNMEEQKVLDPSVLDVFNITITGEFTAGGNPVGIDFNWENFETGKCVLLRIKNSGISDGNNTESPLFYFNGQSENIIKWPNGTYTRPNNGECYIYSILRFRDDNGPLCFGTYSNPYFTGNNL